MTDSEVEAVARALCRENGGRPDDVVVGVTSWVSWARDARAAIKALDAYRNPTPPSGA